jgi:hypothetical protein
MANKSPNNSVDCPFCAREIPISTGQYNCLGHGVYDLQQQFIEEYKNLLKKDNLLLERISRYLYETSDSGLRTIWGTFKSNFPVLSALGGKPKQDKQLLLLDDVPNLYSQDTELNPIQKYEQTLYNIATRSKKFGHNFSLREKDGLSEKWRDRYIVPTFDDDEAVDILSALSDSGYLITSQTSDEFTFSLTNEGFKRAADLKRLVAIGDIVFIAAYFAPELAPARAVIRDVLSNLGYNPYIVIEEPHNDIIDLRIYDNIRKSRFMVADLTCNRQSVYYEIGFAHGLGLNVILTCRKDSFKEETDDFKRVHFDLNHRNILQWENVDELKNILENHILQSFGRYIPKSS